MPKTRVAKQNGNKRTASKVLSSQPHSSNSGSKAITFHETHPVESSIKQVETVANDQASTDYNETQQLRSISYISPSEHLPPLDRHMVLATYIPLTAAGFTSQQRLEPEFPFNITPDPRSRYWACVMARLCCCSNNSIQGLEGAKFEQAQQSARVAADKLLKFLNLRSMYELNREMLKVFAEASESALVGMVRYAQEVPGKRHLLPGLLSVRIGFSAVCCGITGLHNVLKMKAHGIREISWEEARVREDGRVNSIIELSYAYNPGLDWRL